MIVRFAPDEVPYPEPEAGGRERLPPPPDAVRGPYAEIIEKVAKEHGVDAKLVRAVIQVESGYQERARSPKGAMGLMQLMPATARQYAVADPYDPLSNIEAGIKHLKSLLVRFPPGAGARRVQRGRSGRRALPRHSTLSRDARLRLAHPRARRSLKKRAILRQLFARRASV